MGDTPTEGQPSLEQLMFLSYNDPAAEPAFFAALLDATVYMHVPKNDRSGRLRLVSFPHPKTGTYLVPFFTDRQQADEASSPRVSVVSLTCRTLFEIAPGATFILNPNRQYCLFYPEEVALLLQGKTLAPTAKFETDSDVAIEPVLEPPTWLVTTLTDLYRAIPGVERAVLVRRIRSAAGGEEELVVIAIVSDAEAERVGRATTVSLKESCERWGACVDLMTLSPASNYPIDRFPAFYIRATSTQPNVDGRLH
jgi:hypothetical protein